MKCAECGQNITNETMYGLTGWTCDNCVIEGSEGRYNGFHAGLPQMQVDANGKGWTYIRGEWLEVKEGENEKV